MKKFYNIPGYEGIYKINKDGEVLSTGKRTSKNKNKYSDKAHILKICQNKNGYKYFKAWVNNKSKHILIHRAIAIVYIPNPDKKPYINHKDGNKSNNSLDNLEWCTPKENAVHAWNNGLYKTPPTFWKGKRGKNHIQSKPIARIDGNGIIIKKYENSYFAANELSLSPREIRNVASGNRKSTHGYKFIFI